MKKSAILFLSACFSFAVMADAPSGYYSSLEGKCGVELKKAAKEKVKSHKVISYGDATWDAFRSTDVRVVNGKEVWWDMYSNNQVSTNGHAGMNIEHSVANSWWGGTKNDAYKDLFHLNPSDADANNRKANYPLGEISGSPTWTNGVTNVGAPTSISQVGNAKVYEPHDDYKGDFARVFMYMFTVYDDIAWKSTTAWMYDTSLPLLFKPWAVELLLRWSREDPVDQKELSRNEAIYKIQGNRNPFIDMPELAEYIWGSSNTTPFYIGAEPIPGPGPGPVDPVVPVDPTSDVLLNCNFDDSSDISHYTGLDWSNTVTAGNLSGWFIKNYSGNNYASASAYKGTATGGPYEEWLITPVLNIPAGKEAVLTFRTQGAYGCDDSTLGVYLLSSTTPDSSRPLDAAVCTPNPDGAKPVYSDWLQSGDVVLGQGPSTCYVGFKYYSAQGGSGHSATFCLDDVKVTLREHSSVETIEGESAVYVDGDRIVAPEGSRVFSVNGSEFSLAGLSRGLYIVVTPAGRSAKVLVK